MKQLFAIFTFVVLGFYVVAAQSGNAKGKKPAQASKRPTAAASVAKPAPAAPVAPAAPAAQGPQMSFKETTIDYGVIEKGSDRVRKFRFTNTGSEPLVIKSASGSCGCTVPDYPKEPVMPGESATIDVNYDTNREGQFTKTVTLTTNEANGSHLLTIKGEVKPAAPSVPAGNGGLKQ